MQFEQKVHQVTYLATHHDTLSAYKLSPVQFIDFSPYLYPIFQFPICKFTLMIIGAPGCNPWGMFKMG